MRLYLILIFVLSFALPIRAAPVDHGVARKTTVHCEGDKVWLEGVQGWSDGDKESSVHAAQASVMSALGEAISYDYLLGISGLAFRLQVSTDGFCSSSPHPACGYQCIECSTRALPWDIQSYSAAADDKVKVAAVRQAVMASIDRGIPAQFSNEEDGIIVGYQRGGEAWICLHPQQHGGKQPYLEANWPWGVTVYSTRKTAMPELKTLVIESLQQAVAMAITETAPEDYHVGFKAWDDYIAKLEILEKADGKTRASLQQGNAWIYECLGKHRGAAAVYLRQVAPLFDDTAAAHLRLAADQYEALSGKVLSGDKGLWDVAPYPSGQAWTPAQIADQVRRLKAALPLEHAAISEIERALAIIVAPAPAT